MKNYLLIAALAAFLPAISAQAAIISNGTLETTVGQNGSISGNSTYTLDGSGNVTEGGTDIGLDAGAWLWTRLSKGFEYSSTGGNGGGGAFVETSVNNMNGKPRAVAFFADDSKSSTGQYDFAMDVFFNDTNDGDSLLNVELYAWNSGDTAPGLSVGGATADDNTYNVTNLGGSTTILNNVQVTSGSITASTWTNVSLGSVDLGTGYDSYAWRIGMVGAEPGDEVAFDNVTVTAVPEPSAFGLLAGLTAFAWMALRRRK